MKEIKFKKGISILLSIIMLLSTFTSVFMMMTITAKAGTATVYVVDYPRSTDINKNGWGHGKLTYMNGWYTDLETHNTLRAMNSYEGQICYCIEPGTGQNTGDSFTQKDENFFDNFPKEYNKTTDGKTIKTLIGRIIQYGYTGNISTSWVSQSPDGAEKLANSLATQYLIWETIVGERDRDFNKVSTNGKDRILDALDRNHPIYSRIMSNYNRIENNVKNHTKAPSFCTRTTDSAKTIELEWNGKEYNTVLTDTNNVLSNYEFTSSDINTQFDVSGNTLIIKTKTAPKEEITITANKKNSKRKGLVVWSDGNYAPGGGSQDTVTYSSEVNDPVKGFVKAKVSYGSAKIVKTSEDGKVANIKFNIQGNGINKDVITNEKGEIQIDNLKPGIYTVTEQRYNHYNPQETKRVTVLAGQTAVVNFNNTLKRGELKVIKASEDGLNEGVKFNLKGTSISGLEVNEYATTNKSGVATFEDVLIGENYVLSEVDTPDRYVIPANQTATIEWNKVTNKEFNNTLKKWKATVTKSDKETGIEQGNSSLAGAVYGIYKGEQLIDKYTTDKKGQFTTKYYVCGNDWTVREITPSEGYLLDDTIYKVGAEPQNYEIELNDISLDVVETIKKGKIAIIKHADDGSTQIETPEVGAEFEVYIKNAGSYQNAKESERDKLITNEFGFAQTKDLPYGIYTVKQTKGLEGTELMKPFDVFVNENGKIYRYIINNAIFKSLIEIVKKDAETSQIIKASGIGFKVRNTDTGEWITQHINYPTPMDIDVFYTDQNGKLMLPQALDYGNYEIVEQCTTNGYVLDSKPVPFKVDGKQTVVTVEKYNKPQKGKIIVSKIGEVFSSVEEIDEMYKPVYLENNLKGAEFEIYADEDIVTLDGTVRNKKGDLVATIITNEQGKSETSPLYLGKYKIIETKTPIGMIKNSTPQYVELTYAGQEIEITEISTKIYNQRQKVQINLEKILEQDEDFNIGNNGEIQNVQFGLFANEDIVSTDGSRIPKDGLIEVITCDENGKVTFKTDIPFGKYYVREIATEQHYVIDDTKYELEFNYQGENTKIVKIKINNGDKIENKLIRGEIIGKKVDEEGFTIAGATFGLFKDNETKFTKDTAIKISKSNEIGVFGFSEVLYGKWLLKELETANGFVLNETPYKVQVKEEKQVVKIEIENKFIKGAVTTTKVNAETKEKLSGAVFEIYIDVDNNKEFDSKIDKLLSEMTEIEKGIYKLDNLKYGGYFMYEKTAPEGFIKDDKYYYFTIEKDNETVIVENETGVGFTNKPIPKEQEKPKAELPKTSDNSNLGFFIGLLGIAVGGVISLVIIYIKNKKDDNK